MRRRAALVLWGTALGVSAVGLGLPPVAAATPSTTVAAPSTVNATPSTATAPSPKLDAVLRLLGARRHGEVDFVEQNFLAVLKRPVESSGELLYDAPGRLEKRTLEPHPETLVLTDAGVTLQRKGRSRFVDLAAYPQLKPFVDGLRATLAGDRPALERVFRVEFAGDVSRWTLTLRPRPGELAGGVAQVSIDGAGDTLYRVETRQLDGDRSLMTLRPHAAR